MSKTKDNKAGSGMVLTDRDRRIVRDVADFQVLTREQMQRLGHFHSKTRGNAVLARLVRFGYLSRRYQPAIAGTQKAIYLPGPSAFPLLGQTQDEIASERRRLKGLSDFSLAHQMLVTDVRLLYRPPRCQLTRWMNEVVLRSAGLGLVPDGHVEYMFNGARFGAFLELDRGTETLTRWRAKVDAYLRLAASGSYLKVFGRQFFRVLAVATTPGRLDHLRRTTAAKTDRVFWFTTTTRLQAEGPLAAIWLRPVGAQLHSLTEP